MDPVTIGSLALGGGSLISGILGANKQAKLQKQQMKFQNQIANRQLDQAELDQHRAVAAQIDQYGNKVFYDPVTNTWQTQLSAQGQKMSDAEYAELLKQLTVDVPMARNEAIENAGVRSNERQLAGSLALQLQDQISGRSGVKADNLAASLRLNRAEAEAAAMRQAMKGFNTNAVRSGMSVSAAGDALSRAGKDWADYAAMNKGNTEIEGLTMADEINQQRRGSLIDAYAALASRGASGGGASYTPTGQQSALASSLSNSRTAALQGSQLAGQRMQGASNAAYQAGQNAANAVPNYSGAFKDAISLWDAYGGDIVGAATRNRTKPGSGSGIEIGTYTPNTTMTGNYGSKPDYYSIFNS